MEKIFKLKEKGSNLSNEILGGLVTFFAMSYIIFVNPSLLSETRMNWNAVMLATCIASAIGCFLTGFMANVPFAQAPGMGLNAFFTYSICFGMGYSWQQGLAIVFISGIIFTILMISPVRSMIIASIPAFLKSALSAGIGMFIALIGLINSGIVSIGAVPEMGDIIRGAPLLALIGLTITSLLLVWKIRGAIIIGIVVTTIIGIPFGLTAYTPMAMDFSMFGEVFGRLSFAGLTAVEGGALTLVTAVISFFIVDCFDTAGTLVGCAANAGMLNEKGELPHGDRAMLADAIATVVGSVCGTSTVTTYVESSTGIAEGARTGLSSIVVGVLFVLACFLLPIAGIVPGAATAPALIIVGVYMLAGAAKVNWADMEQAIPAFLTIAIMPFTYNISYGIGFGFISFTIIKICRGKAKEVPVLISVISVVFIIMFILRGL